MSSQISANSYLLQNANPEVIRRMAGFHPNIWGDRFVTYMAEDKILIDRKEHRITKLKDEVKRELLVVAVEPSQQLNIIDAIQRLGVAYHFEKEIEETLLHIHEKYHDYEVNNILDDLYIVSLRFRLLRQQGYNITCDIFSNYKDKNGNFKKSLVGDAPGMLEFYEATHMRKHGEDILDEAFAFTSSQLELMKSSHLSEPLASQVAHALKQPIHKGIPRLEARTYMSIYHEIDSHNKGILELAKLDFNLVQSMHKKELSNITRWWKDLDFETKLPFVRDRVVEGYFWILGVYFEPQYSLARRIMTKVIAMTSVIDDIYDAYGTLEELELFTQEIERWNLSNIDQLPDYMKFCYEALLDVYEEIENDMAKQGRSYHVYYAKKKAMQNLVEAYFEEAQWFNEKYQPTMEEYMRLAIKTSGYSMLTTISFVGMGDIVTKKAFEWVCSDPKIVTASSIICRLMDDITSHKFEQKRGHVMSAVECYTKEYGVSEQQAYDELRKQIVNAWKDINEECLQTTNMPMPVLTRVLNLARVMDAVYKEEDGYTHVGKATRDRIALMLIDPMPI